MTKAKTCFASSVCCSDKFCELPESSRLLYYQLGFETDTIGEIHGASRIARGYGFSGSDLRTLVETGFIVEADGRRFIRHTFVNNALSNDGMKQAALNAFASAEHFLGFEGDAFKSAYRLLDESSSNVSPMLDTNTIQSNEKGNATESKPIERETETQLQEKDNGARRATTARRARAEATCPDPAPCPRCHKVCAVAEQGGILYGWCDVHGEFFIDPESGEYLEH